MTLPAKTPSASFRTICRESGWLKVKNNSPSDNEAESHPMVMAKAAVELRRGVWLPALAGGLPAKTCKRALAHVLGLTMSGLWPSSVRSPLGMDARQLGTKAAAFAGFAL